MNTNRLKIKKAYSIVIRTLGTGGVKYKRLLDSIKLQTLPPQNVYVIIAEGYSLPSDRLGYEKFIYTKKGMWHQRVFGLEYASLQDPENYLLVLDDDLSFEANYAEKSLECMMQNNIDVLITGLSTERSITPMFSVKNFYMSLLGVRVENHFQKERVKIMSTGGFMTNTKLDSEIQITQSGPFAAFWIKPDVVRSLHLADEYWLEETRYALPDDQVFFYKCHILGWHQCLHKSIAVCHHDHGSSDPNRLLDASYANGRNFYIFWHRFLYKRANFLYRIWLILSIIYRIIAHSILYLVTGIRRRNMRILSSYIRGVYNGICYIRSEKYKSLTNL